MTACYADRWRDAGPALDGSDVMLERGRRPLGAIGTDLSTDISMRVGVFSASVEVGGDGWCTAWVPELLGCFVNLPSEKAALRALPAAILAYLRWLRRHGDPVRLPRAVAVHVVERHERAEPMRWGNYEVLHEFERRPVTRAEVARVLRWMRFMRSDTLHLLGLLLGGGLDWSRPGQTRTIGEHLHHLADSDRWYLGRVALVPAQ